MRPVHIWLVAGTTGAIIGAVFTHYLAAVSSEPVTPIGSHAGVNQTEAASRDRKSDLSVTATNARQIPGPTMAHHDAQCMPSTTTVAVPAASSRDTTEVKRLDVAQEEAMVQIITSRLYDPSATLADMMQSEEMLMLSDESRERVVAKVVGMLNRGEIDAHVFMSKR